MTVRAAVLAVVAMVAGLLTALGTSAPAMARTHFKVFPIPTSSAAPGRIVTATNGNMWFIETKVGATKARVGRVTPKGTVKEYVLSTAANDDGMDLAADHTGGVWVLLRHQAVHVNKAGHVVKRVPRSSDYDIGEAIRVAPNGTPGR